MNIQSMGTEDDGIDREGTDIEQLDALKNIVTDATEPSENGEEKETPAESSTDKKPEGDDLPADGKDKTKTEEDDVPFHKHPRFKQLTDTNKSLKENNEKLGKDVEELKGLINRPREDENASAADKAFKIKFKNLFGTDDEAAVDLFKQTVKETVGFNKDDLLKEAMDKIQSQQIEASNETKKWQDWVQDNVKTLIDDGDIKKDEQNELLKLMDKYRPTDDGGNLDFRKGVELLRGMNKKEPNTDKKKVASNASGGDSGGSSGKGALTPKDVRHKSMSELALE